MTLSLSNRGGFLTGPMNSHYPESLKCCLYGALTDQYPPSATVSLPSAGRRRFHPTWSSMGRRTNSASDSTHHKQTCTTTEKHFWVSASACVCVCSWWWCHLSLVWSTLCSKQTAVRGSLGHRWLLSFLPVFTMHSGDTHTHTCRHSFPSACRLSGACAEKTFHQALEEKIF